MVNDFLNDLLTSRLSDPARAFWEKSRSEIAEGISETRFAALLAMASRHAKRQSLDLSEEELARAEALVPGWSPVAWNRLELLRINLLLARPDLETDAFAEAFEALFRFADEGETCALYRSLPLLPRGERFVWRAAEACRTNMLTVFEAVALDSPYPVNHFDDTAWHQLVIKSLFLDVPLYRISGLDDRLTPELTRMALDWAEERHSAGRTYHLGLWLCLGPHHPERVETLLSGHWPQADALERQAMLLAAGRAGQSDWLARFEPDSLDATLGAAWRQATEGHCGRKTFAPLFAQLETDQ
ncbi:EboA domain-containing protein [Marinimicrobium sp. C2-29]|uniref:EboA domain-containing protein n=1 Tax=Marinimicrobium sp. C2-29 TaxID=3139825 RepID=UPI003139FDB9